MNHTFTDQEEDDEAGLYNYKARLYDPLLGKFISADSIVPEPGNLQAYNRYSYCLNNPVVYTDPSGHWFGIDDLVSAVIGAIVGGVEAAITGQNIGEGALKGAFSAWVMYNTGMELRGAEIITVTEAGKEMVTNLPAAIAVHTAAGATTGAFNTLVSGGDLGQNMLSGALSAGMAKGLGNYIPGDIAGNAYADFGIGLTGHAAIGGISGGITSHLYGGTFGQGFEQGAMAGAYGYVFNKGGAKLRRWFNTYIKPSITPTDEQRDRVSSVKLSETQIKAQRSYVYRIDRTAYWSCVGEQLASGDWALPMTVAFTPHPVATAVGFVWFATTVANDAFTCRKQATRGYEY